MNDEKKYSLFVRVGGERKGCEPHFQNKINGLSENLFQPLPGLGGDLQVLGCFDLLRHVLTLVHVSITVNSKHQIVFHNINIYHKL